MRTGSKISGLFLFLLAIGLNSCQSQSVEADMDEWCACEKEAIDNVDHKSVCNELMTDITRKYEFDPKAVETIREKAAACY